MATTAQAPNAGSAEMMKPAGAQTPTSESSVSVRRAIGSLPSGRLRRVSEYVQQNLEKNLTLAELAGVAYMSPFHFARLFKSSTGVPPHRFVVRQRLTRARTCLAMEGHSIAQISRMVGYRTPSHFTTVFRRALGVTPGAYRAAALQANRSNGEGGGR
jgi:AraC family transcriptional regulator